MADDDDWWDELDAQMEPSKPAPVVAVDAAAAASALLLGEQTENKNAAGEAVGDVGGGLATARSGLPGDAGSLEGVEPGGAEAVDGVMATLATLEGEDLARYETFRRSQLSKSQMKRLISAVTAGAPVTEDVMVVVGGVAKVLVGELVTEARGIAGGDAPLTPQQIRDVYQRLLRRGAVVTSPTHTRPRPLMR
ncbi:hypothetical protein PPROV_001025900 [Pycnococcus provasolii]|uniref:TAFII28-like protein domain-containing protein n=2 Tax=Pycnococcus provasolii TaxID=41880 RepID=A0A830I1C7_9CHLO|nr:hypothetical protein PPROV_001025900 [Pycnococcus provasolii]